MRVLKSVSIIQSSGKTLVQGVYASRNGMVRRLQIFNTFSEESSFVLESEFTQCHMILGRLIYCSPGTLFVKLRRAIAPALLINEGLVFIYIFGLQTKQLSY